MIEKYLNNRFITLYVFPFILGSLTVFSFQPFNFTFINFLVMPLFFYVLVFINKKSKTTYRKKPYKKNLFIYGTLFGFGFYISGTHWISNSLTFDDNFKFLIPFSLILIPLFLSLFISIVTLFLGPFLSFNFSSILILSLGLAISDYIRSKILTGFPWNLWSYSFSWATELIQIINKIGLFSFNLITLTIFMLPVIFLFKYNFGKKILYFSIVPIILFVFYVYGNYSLNHNQKLINSIDNKFYIKVISPNFELKYNLNLDEIESRLDSLARYSSPEKNRPTLFVWPEGVFSGYSYEEILSLSSKFTNYFDKDHYVVFGINRLDKKRNGFYNSLVIVNNEFQIIREYRKQKLVPFGEFLPFEKLFSKFGFKKITEGYGSFLQGTENETLKIGKINILPLICYELIFPKFIQQSHKDTNLIINISEDGWFGRSIGPHQHFAKAIYRAIEQNSYLIRSANKGISGIVNNKGELIKKLESTEAGLISMEVPLVNSDNKNKNDLIFFVLLITYILLINIYKTKNV